jgi:hypothetical protein
MEYLGAGKHLTRGSPFAYGVEVAVSLGEKGRVPFPWAHVTAFTSRLLREGLGLIYSFMIWSADNKDSRASRHA